jgi:hypothetical protein
MKKYSNDIVDFIIRASWLDFEESFDGVKETEDILLEFKIMDEIPHIRPRSFIPNSNGIEPTWGIGITKEQIEYFIGQGALGFELALMGDNLFGVSIKFQKDHVPKEVLLNKKLRIYNVNLED